MNIKKMSRLLEFLSYAIMLIMPALLITFWLGVGASHNGSHLVAVGVNFIPPHLPILHPLSVNDRALGFIIGAVPIALLVFLFYSLSSLFRRFYAGEIFSLQVVHVFKRIGYLLLAYEVVDTLFDGLMAVAMTWHNPTGYRYFELSFSGVNGAMILTAVIVLLISGIMAEACKLEEEHSLTI